jgi:hypothetical protein
VSTPHGSRPAPVGLVLRFDGVLHSGDLAVQAFARHLTDALPTDRVRAVIAGMRGFLEGKPDLIPPGTELASAEDGYQAVVLLGRAAGLSDAVITAARRASRADLAASAWAVDASDGLDELLAAVDGRVYLAVLTEPDDPAAPAVLDSIGIRVDELVAGPLPAALANIRFRVENADPQRILVIGTRWLGELSGAFDAGYDTALVDRYRLGRGTPTLRSPDVAGLVESVRRWSAAAGRRIRTGAVHD